jgi:hypothetical protein
MLILREKIQLVMGAVSQSERIGRLVRKTKCFSKLKCRLEAALAVFQFYWNFMKEMDGKSTPGMVEGIIDRRITWSVFFHTIIKYD